MAKKAAAKPAPKKKAPDPEPEEKELHLHAFYGGLKGRLVELAPKKGFNSLTALINNVLTEYEQTEALKTLALAKR